MIPAFNGYDYYSKVRAKAQICFSSLVGQKLEAKNVPKKLKICNIFVAFSTNRYYNRNIEWICVGLVVQ